MSRSNKRRIIVSESDVYRPDRKERDLKKIHHYESPRMRNPTPRQRSQTTSTRHIWKYGDRLYNLAHRFYGDSRFWWVIAWWNGYGTEADIKTGSPLTIPLDIAEALKVLEG